MLDDSLIALPGNAWIAQSAKRLEGWFPVAAFCERDCNRVLKCVAKDLRDLMYGYVAADSI